MDEILDLNESVSEGVPTYSFSSGELKICQAKMMNDSMNS